jgi:hypothetical protein
LEWVQGRAARFRHALPSDVRLTQAPPGVEFFVAAAKKLKVGDPEDPATDVGPMISAAAADRVEQMVADAIAKGARLVLKPKRRDCILGPAIVAEAPAGARLMGRGGVRPGGRGAAGRQY